MIYRTIVISIVCTSLLLMGGCTGSDPKPSPSSQNASQDDPRSSSREESTTSDTSGSAVDDTTVSKASKSPTRYKPSDFGSLPGNNSSTSSVKPSPFGIDPSKLFRQLMGSKESKKSKNTEAALIGKPRTRPEDITKWIETDFIPARDENDSKLGAALVYHAKKYRKNPLFAMILAKIIEPKVAAPEIETSDEETAGRRMMFGNDGGRGRDRGRRDKQARPINQKLVETTVILLGTNDTPEAAKTLREIIKNRKFNVVHPETATKAALQGLAIINVNRSQNDEVLFTALTDPTKYRKKEVKDTTSAYGDDISRSSRRRGGNDDKRMTAEELAKEAEECLKPIASEGLRILLADYLLSSSTSPADRQIFRPWFTESSPANVLGQLKIYEASPPGPELLAKLEEQFTNYSGLAMARLLGTIPMTPDLSLLGDEKAIRDMVAPTKPSTGWGSDDDGGRGNFGGNMTSPRNRSGGRRRRGNASDLIDEYLQEKAEKTSPEKELVRLTKKIWGANIAEAVANRLNQIPGQNPISSSGFGEIGGGRRSSSSSDNSEESIALACTMPLDKVRHAILRRCKSHYQDGPDTALGKISSGRSGDNMDPATSGAKRSMGSDSNAILLEVLDPGLLVVVKMLPREDPHALTKGSGGHGNSGTGNAGDMQRQWFEASKQLVTQILGQCFVAASPTTETMENDPCPITPHKGAGIVKRLDLKLPNDATGLLGQLPTDPIEIHYIRIEEVGNLQRMLSYYKRAVKGENHTLGNMGYWFDKISGGATPGKRRSIDVIISPGVEKPVDPFHNNRNSRKKKGVPIVIQILTIETADPASK